MPRAVSTHSLSRESSRSEHDEAVRISDTPPRPESKKTSPIRDRLLESVSTLRDAAMTEIKVWGGSQSPPVQPVSSQSSDSEEQVKPRSRPSLKKSPSGKDILEETVTSIRQAASGTFTAASGTITELKQWAADSTKSRPLHPTSSSVSSSSDGSVVEHGPVQATTTPRRRTSQHKHANSSNNRDVIVETVSSFRNAANDTLTGIKEWAAQLPSSHDSSEAEAASHVQKVYPKQGEEQASPERAARVLYGAQTNYETTHKYESNHKSKQKSPLSSRFHLMQDLVSPFLVCGGGANSVDDDDEPERCFKSKPLRFDDEEPTRESAWSNWNPVIGALERRADSFDESILTYDTIDEEMDQIRRMTSWGTMGTMGTAVTQNTAFTQETSRTLETCDGTAIEARVLVQDDHGNAIPPVLLEKAKKRREQRKQRKVRKRTVKFDYPPISSLKECPRADPEDLPNLFFTEEELDQIEDDRYNTKIADDVEIVAVSSINSKDSLSDSREGDVVGATPTRSGSSSDDKSSPSGASFSKYTSTPKLARGGKGRAKSPFPGRGRSCASLPDSPPKSRGFDNHSDEKGAPTQEEPGGTSSCPRQQQRLLKGVQIFLRERSLG